MRWILVKFKPLLQFLISFKNYAVAGKLKNLLLFYVSSSVSSDTEDCNSKPANIENISGGWICFYDKQHTFGPGLTWQLDTIQMIDSQQSMHTPFELFWDKLTSAVVMLVTTAFITTLTLLLSCLTNNCSVKICIVCICK